MHPSGTLTWYLARLFALWIGATLLVLLAVTFLADFIELMRRGAAKPDAVVGVLAMMALLRLPNMAQELLPFAVLFGTMIAIWQFDRNRELVIVRSSGVSVWQFLLPAILVALFIGTFKVSAFSPLASATLSRFEQLESKYLHRRASLLDLSGNGLWLRQAGADGQTVIHARGVSPGEMKLNDVIIFLFEGTDQFVGRMDAATASLKNGYWELNDTWLTGPDRPARYVPKHRLPTDLTTEKIQDSFAPPETLSFWSLPGFIRVLEEAGFSAQRHRLHWHSLLADPLLFCAMVLIAATFALRPSRRRGGAIEMIPGGLFAGLLLYVASDIVLALGVSANLPVVLAAWAPAGVSTLLGVAMLLHFEDG